MTDAIFTEWWDGAGQVIASLAPVIEFVLALAVVFWLLKTVLGLFLNLGRHRDGGGDSRPSERR